MRTLQHIPVLIFLLAGCSSPTGEDSQGSVGAILTARRTMDLRVLFRSDSEVRELENKRASSIAIGRDLSTQREIIVGDGLTLDKVVLAFRGRPYDGQIKVVSRDHIIQTPLVEYHPEKQREILVKPGDLVFIQARE